MIPNKSGAIVNIASYAAYFSFPGISAYTGSKGAIAQLTRTAALEAIAHEVRVNAIGVGNVVTNLLIIIWAMGPVFLLNMSRALPSGGPRSLARLRRS